MQLTLNEFFMYLIQRRGFYGRLVSSLQRVAKPGLGTMAVGIRDGRAVFFYDPAFIKMLDLPTALFAIEHEMLHLILDHIPRYFELLSIQPTDKEKAKAKAVYNVAMDCAINTLLRSHEGFEGIQQVLRDSIRAKYPEKPELADDPNNGLVLPEKFDLPHEATFEAYQYLLMRRVNIIEILVNFTGGSDHSQWGHPEDGDKDGKGEGGHDDIIFGEGDGVDGMSSEELISQAHRVREQIKQALRAVARSNGGIGRGTMPAGVEEWLEGYIADPIIPWWEIFSTRAKMSRASKYARSCTVPNRTLMCLSEEDDRIIPMPGRIRDKSWRILFCVDTSGSMSTESLEIAKSELQHMLNVDEAMEIRYMEGDAAIHTDVVLKRGDEIPREVVGRGGTDFTAYFVHMAQYVHNDLTCPDLVVIYTDGYAPPVEIQHRLPPEIPILWLVTPQHSEGFHDHYGEILVCDPDHNGRYKKAA